MLRATTVSIVHDDASRAGHELGGELLDAMGSRPDLVLVVVSAKYEVQKVIDALAARLGPDVRIAGCSSFAEISEEGGTTESITAMGLKVGGALRVETISAIHDGGDHRSLGKQLGEKARMHDPSLLILFPDAFLVNATELLLGVQEVLGASIPIVGGGAGDFAFKRTYQVHNEKVFSGGAVAAVFSGPLEIVTAARSGWKPVGATHRVNHIEKGNVILEIDGHPALDLYEKYLGNRAAEMPAISIEYPLGIVGGIRGTQKPPEGEMTLLRAVTGVDRERKALLLSGDVPEGAEVRMTTATKDEVIEGAIDATKRAIAALPNASCALLFDCMARKLLLGPKYRSEVTKSFEQLGDIPKFGFYTFGELSPVEGTTMYHNETFTIALLKG